MIDMKLILSSCDFQNENSRQIIYENLPAPISLCRVLFVPNEKSTPERLKSGFYCRRLQAFGFSQENIIVFDPAAPSHFCDLDIDVVYISGGNTFKMMHTLRQCSFDQEIIRLVRSGVTYIGGSAGAHLASSDLSHLTCYDDVPDGMLDFSGMNSFRGILLCHFSPDRQAHYSRLREELEFDVCALTDEDTLVISS